MKATLASFAVAVLLFAHGANAQIELDAGTLEASTSDAHMLDSGAEADHITSSGCSCDFPAPNGPALTLMACVGMISIRFLRSRRK